MRQLLLTLLLLLFISCQSVAQSPLLQTKITLKVRNVYLQEFLKEVNEKYNINFSYVNDLIASEKRISFHCKERNLKDVLDQILNDANLTYQQVGNQIVLKKIDHKLKGIRQSLSQTIRGLVLDKHSQVTLPGATIILLSDNGYVATTTNNEGKFRLENVSLGRYDLKVTYIGYKEKLVSDIILNSGKEIVLSVNMEENIVEGEAVTVYAQRDKSAPNNDLIISSVTSLRPESIGRFAGSKQDPSRIVSSYAGVINGRDPRNDIIVRGNSAYGLLWRLEGVDIPNPNHYTYIANSGGAFSILNSNLLGNSDFITGAFPSEYGNKTSAVLDIRLRNGNNEKRENTIQAGLNGAEFTTEGPISKKGASYLVGFRFFDFKLLELLGLNFVPRGIPQFSDAAFKVNFPSKRTGNISVWGIWGKSNIDISDGDADTMKWGKATYINNDKLFSDMYAIGIGHTYSYNSHLLGRLNISRSGSNIQYSNREIFRNNIQRTTYNLKNNEGQSVINYSLFYNKNPFHHFKIGVTFKQLFYNNYDLMLIPDDSTYVNGLNNKGSSFFNQSFLHWQYKISPVVELNTGLYYQYFYYNKNWSLEPRMALKVNLTEEQNLTLAAGIHSQTQPLAYYQYQVPDTLYKFSDYNKKLGFTKSLHLVAGYNINISQDWRFKAEAYYQYIYKVPVTLMRGFGSYSALNEGSEYSFSVFDSTVNEGTGKNLGIELTLEKYFSNKYYFLTCLSLLDSKYKGADGIERNTTFNIGHILNVLGGKAFDLDATKRKQLFVDAKVNYSGGRRFVRVDENKTFADGNGVIHYDLDQAFNNKVKNYFRTDLKVTVNFNREKSTHNFFVAVDNVFNTKNESSYDWDRMEGRVKTYYQLGFFPYLGYKIQF